MARIQNEFTQTQITQATAQIIDFTISNAILLTNDEPLTPFASGYYRFTSVSQISQYFGLNTRTYRYLKALLSNPLGNISLQNGSVFVFETTAGTNATQGTFATDDITSTIWDALKVITDGSFKVVIKEGANPVKEEVISKFGSKNIDLTKYNSLAEFVVALNNSTNYSFVLVGEKLQITNPVFGAGYTIELEGTTGVGTSLIDTGLITVASPVVVAGINADITNAKEVVPSVIRTLQNDLASVPMLLTHDLDRASFEEFATFIQNSIPDIDGTLEAKNIFPYSFSTLNPLLTGIADKRNTDRNFKTFIHALPTKDTESLHNFTAEFFAIALSRDYTKPNNKRRNTQGITISTSGSIQLIDTYLQGLNYSSVGFTLQEKGVTRYYNSGTPRQTAVGVYLDGIDKVMLTKTLFKYNFENYIDYNNATLYFNSETNEPPLATITQISIKERWNSTILDTLANNSIVLPFEGENLPFTITDGLSASAKANELQSMQARGYYCQHLPITADDKANSRLRFAFLLNTPYGVLKIESVGIAFE